jgi:hypothetical protein
MTATMAGRPASAPLASAPASVRLPGQHFAAATLYLLAGSLGLCWIAPDLAAGAWLSPRVGGVTHLFTLGWLTTTIFGALTQLLPVALGAPLRSSRAAEVTFWSFVPGAGLLSAGVAASRPALLIPGVLLLVTGIVIALVNLAATLARATQRDVTWRAIALALAFLAATLGLGLALAHNLHTGFIASARLQVLGLHLHVALVGWVLLMIVGVSHRLLPMFLLAHGADTRWTGRALAGLASGLVVLGAGIAASRVALEWAGALLLVGGLACFLGQARAFHRARVRRRLDPGMCYAATALVFLAAASALGIAVLATRAAHPRLATAYIVTGLLGGIVLYVIGFFYKIVPLLAWTARFRGRMGREPVPTVAEMYSVRLAQVQLGLMAGGVAVLAGAVGAGSAAGARAGAVFFLSGVLLFLVQLARVVAGRAPAPGAS